MMFSIAAVKMQEALWGKLDGNYVSTWGEKRGDA